MLDTRSLAAHGPVIPVIVIQRLEQAVPLARALVEGGVKVLEVTLRTPVALAAIEAIARAVPEAVVGAGTLRLPADAQAARDAGSGFAVSPGYTPALGAACRAAKRNKTGKDTREEQNQEEGGLTHGDIETLPRCIAPNRPHRRIGEGQ